MVLTIGKLAERGGVGVETVRYYQRRGLLSEPPKPEAGGVRGGVRRYGDEDVRRLRFIRAAQSAGFTLEQIQQLLALDRNDDRVRARELAQARIVALDARISELTMVRDALRRLADDCVTSGTGPCPIIDAFET